VACPDRCGRSDDASIDPLQGSGDEEQDQRPSGKRQKIARRVADTDRIEGARQRDQRPHHDGRDDEGEQRQPDGEESTLDPVVGALATVGDPDGDHERVEGVRHQPDEGHDADDEAHGDLTRRDRRDASELRDDEGRGFVGKRIGERFELGAHVVGFGDEAIERHQRDNRGDQRDGEIERDPASGEQRVVLGHVTDVRAREGEQAGSPHGVRAVAHRNHAGSDIPSRVPHGVDLSARRRGMMDP